MANVLLGVTGSVAAIKAPELVAALLVAQHNVKVVVTEPALYFFKPSDLPAGTLFRDSDEWPKGGYHRGDEILHIELRKWADLFVIAPLDANTLGKMANGLADNCLTCVARAWDMSRPMILVPAMNTLMWDHPATARHLAQLRQDSGDRGPIIIGPVAKELACGDFGLGGMADVSAIVAAIAR